MGDFKIYLSKMTTSYQGSEEEKLCGDILFSETDIQLGDKRLNNIAAYTYNAGSCQKIFVMIEKTLSPTDNPWKTIYKGLLLLHTIVLFGPELAIDKAIQLSRFILPLTTYNSALARKGLFSSGGTDYGAPVRAEAKTLDDILRTDETIRKARVDARGNQGTLVPVGELLGDMDDLTASHNKEFNPAAGSQSMTYGQGINTSVGAGFGLHNVPGMYEGRPDRYFDSDSTRKQLLVPTGAVKDSQLTRDAQAPSLLDIAFDDVANSASALPPADYLPALERQKELEAQLLKQQEQLKQLQELQKQQQRLQELQQQQAQQQQQQQLFPYVATSSPLPPAYGGHPPQQQPLPMGGLPHGQQGYPSPMHPQAPMAGGMAPYPGMGAGMGAPRPAGGMHAPSPTPQPQSMGYGPMGGMGGPGGPAGMMPPQQMQQMQMGGMRGASPVGYPLQMGQMAPSPAMGMGMGMAPSPGQVGGMQYPGQPGGPHGASPQMMGMGGAATGAPHAGITQRPPGSMQQPQPMMGMQQQQQQQQHGAPSPLGPGMAPGMVPQAVHMQNSHSHSPSPQMMTQSAPSPSYGQYGHSQAGQYGQYGGAAPPSAPSPASVDLLALGEGGLDSGLRRPPPIPPNMPMGPPPPVPSVPPPAF